MTATLFLAIGIAGFGASKTVFEETFESGLRSMWKEVKFEGKTPYWVEKDEGNAVLRALADGTATGLAVDQRIPASKGLVFQWRWKIDVIPEGGTDTRIETFDHTARVFVAFRTRVGPPRTINYVWANTMGVGKTFHHPRSGRARFIVLQTGNSRTGEWLSEKRNLAADWELLFGDQSMPEIVGIGLMTDSDGTKRKVNGWYDELRMEETGGRESARLMEKQQRAAAVQYLARQPGPRAFQSGDCADFAFGCVCSVTRSPKRWREVWGRGQSRQVLKCPCSAGMPRRTGGWAKPPLEWPAGMPAILRKGAV